MLVAAIGFLLLRTLPADFPYWSFAFYIFLVGAGQGLFSSPNSAAIMNSVPMKFRGAASGMRATFMNSGMMLSMGIFFTIVIARLSQKLPTALTRGLIHSGLPVAIVGRIAHVSPIEALFSALLGYNPLRTIAGSAVLGRMSPVERAHLVSRSFFPSLIGTPFMDAMRVVFLFALVISLIAAIASLLRGKQVYAEETQTDAKSPRAARESLLAIALIAAWRARAGARPGSPKEVRRRLIRAMTLLTVVLADGEHRSAHG